MEARTAPFHYHLVLLEPQIPPNTGNAGRLCVATQSTLHLIEPLGFGISDKEVRRAGLDYWKFVDLVVHPNWQSFETWAQQRGIPCFFFEVGAKKSLYEERELPREAALIFGRETTGIPEDLLARNANHHYSLPMFSQHIRSLNLANTASICLYEFIRQQVSLPLTSRRSSS